MSGTKDEDDLDPALAELYQEEDSGPKAVPPPATSKLDPNVVNYKLLHQAFMAQGKELGELKQRLSNVESAVTDSEARILQHFDEVIARLVPVSS